MRLNCIISSVLTTSKTSNRLMLSFKFSLLLIVIPKYDIFSLPMVTCPCFYCWTIGISNKIWLVCFHWKDYFSDLGYFIVARGYFLCIVLGLQCLLLYLVCLWFCFILVFMPNIFCLIKDLRPTLPFSLSLATTTTVTNLVGLTSKVHLHLSPAQFLQLSTSQLYCFPELVKISSSWSVRLNR